MYSFSFQEDNYWVPQNGPGAMTGSEVPVTKMRCLPCFRVV